MVGGATRAGAGPKDHDAAFSTLCKAQYDSLVAVITVVVRDRGAAEDVAQEALARTWMHWARVADLNDPAGWTRHVALNLARSYLRRRRIAELARPSLHEVADPEATKRDESDSTLMTALATLTPRQREAIAWRYLADLSIHEVADLMQCKEGTVRALTSQGLSRLRQAIRKREEAG